MSSETWTIGELAERAAAQLRSRAQPLSGRVREVPGERLIRWYSTIGLVDPPLTRQGRVARYGRRHLLQLVAVKRLQAAGLSIADIRTALADATDAMLEEAAALPPTAPPDPRPRFWARQSTDETLRNAIHPPAARPPSAPAASQPALAPSQTPGPSGMPAPAHGRGRSGEHGAGGAGAHMAGGRTSPAAHDAEDRTPIRADERVGGAGGGPVWGVRLGGRVTLVVEGRAPSDDDIQAVLAAADPLLAVLEERKLA